MFDRVPASTHLLAYRYFTKPTFLIQGIEEPSLPSEYHMILVWAALKEYAMYDEAPELYQKGEGKYQTMLARLETETLPNFQLAGPLA